MPAVTPLIVRFRNGSRSAFADLFTLFFQRQVGHAEAALGHGASRSFDGEDVALSAFRCLWQEVMAGKFSGGLEHTDGLLSILSLLTAQKTMRAQRFDRQQLRDTRRTVPIPDQFDDFVQDPNSAVFSHPLNDLPPSLTVRQRSIIQMLSEGWERVEVANALQCSMRTIDRELAATRATLREHLAE